MSHWGLIGSSFQSHFCARSALVAINTSKLLMQSRIGDEAELKRADIPVLQALPALGAIFTIFTEFTFGTK